MIVMHENARKSKGIIMYYKLRAECLDKCVVDIASTIRRVREQERAALTPPPTIMDETYTYTYLRHNIIFVKEHSHPCTLHHNLMSPDHIK